MFSDVIDQIEKKGLGKKELDLLKNAKNAKDFYKVVTRELVWFLDKDKNDGWIDWNDYIKNADLKQLDGEDWGNLLEVHPELAKKCNWEELNVDNWTHLLRYQPQFANKCDFEEFESDDWDWLLKYQPSLKKYRK